MRTIFNKRRENENDLRIHRNTEGTIFEIAVLFLIILMWIAAVLIYRHSPETIPTHFDLKGNPNGYSSRSTLFIIAAIGTAISAIMLASAYAPSRRFNMPGKITTFRQQWLMARMMRILAVVIALLLIDSMFMTAHPGNRIVVYVMMALVALLFILPLYFTIRAGLMKKQQKN